MDKVTMRLLLSLLVFLSAFTFAQPINKSTSATIGTKIYRGVEAPGSGCDCGSTNSASPCTGTSVTKSLSDSRVSSQIKFNFTCSGGGPCKCGKFANGHDFWVAPSTNGGTVDIIAMTPATEGAADSTLRSGWVANPSAITTNSFMDGRLGGGTSTGTPLNPSSINPYSINTTTTPVTTIVKSRSRSGGGADCRATDSIGMQRYCFLHAEVLTVLDSVPANAGSTILRPPLTGTEKPLISTSSINLALLPELAPPTRPDGTTIYPFGKTSVYSSLTTALDYLAPPKVEWGASGDWPYWQQMPPYLNFGRTDTGYPSAKMEPLLEALQLLTLNPGAYTAEKDLLAIRAVQWGIDYYYMWKARNYGPMYKTNGGHSVGRYQPTLVAAALMTGATGTAMQTDMQRMNVNVYSGDGTADRCGFDVGNVMWYFTDTAKAIYGVYNITGCGGYSLYTKQTNSLYIDPAHVGDNGRLTINADNDAGDVGTCTGAYQGINNGPMLGTVNLIKAIPALRAIDFDLLEGYTMQRLDSGAYCRADQDPANNGFWGECSGGTNSGWPCRSAGDCGTGSCIRDGDVQYTSWFGWNMLKQYRSCYDAKTCAGMEGL